MRLFLLGVVLAVVFPVLVFAKVPVYAIVEVDNGTSSLTVNDGGKLFTTKARADATVRIDGVRSDFRALEPRMQVKFTLAEPGVALGIDASAVPVAGEAAAAPRVAPAAGALAFVPHWDLSAGRVFDVTLAANSPEAYEIGAVRKGMRITFRYLEGNWKSWGRLANVNPDYAKSEGGDKCRVAIALPGTDGEIGPVLELVPPGTAKQAFVFQAKQDYERLVLRINGTGDFGKNPGKVVYRLRVQPTAGPR